MDTKFGKDKSKSMETVKYPSYNGISLAHGDITTLYVDCLVCHLITPGTSRSNLLSSISKAAGPKFMKAFKDELDWKSIKEGEVKFTKGFSSRAFEI